MIKILHGADFHLGARFRGLSPEKARIRKEQQREIPRMLAQLCREEACDLVLLSGDLFDRPNPDRDSVEALLDGLTAMEVPVYISPGNHDYLCPDSPYLTEEWPDHVHIFKKPELISRKIPGLPCRIWGAGYESMDCPPLLSDMEADGPEEYRLLILHGDPLNAGSPCCPIRREELAASGFHYAALGHIHKAGGCRAGNTFCAWPGCPMGTGFDETGEKGVLITELDGDKAESRFVPLGLGCYESIRLPAQELLRDLPQNTENDIYRITLTGETEPLPLQHLKSRLESRFFHVELLDKTTLPGALWEASGKDSLEGMYFKLLQEQMEDSENRELLLLAARISRKILDGQEVELP